MNPRTALAIVTFVDASRPPEVGLRLREAIASLEKTSYAGPVILVDDGSTSDEHKAYLCALERSGRYRVVRRTVNGGISRAKNTCLRALMETGFDIGFLAEDDILFREGWDRAYKEAMERSLIKHFSWYCPDPKNCVVACNDALVTITAGMLGLLLTFTREVIDVVGGFKVLPHRYGHEHIHWTHRIVRAGLAPFPADIVDSRHYVRSNKLPPALDEADIRTGCKLNRPSARKIARIHEPLME